MLNTIKLPLSDGWWCLTEHYSPPQCLYRHSCLSPTLRRLSSLRLRASLSPRIDGVAEAMWGPGLHSSAQGTMRPLALFRPLAPSSHHVLPPFYFPREPCFPKIGAHAPASGSTTWRLSSFRRRCLPVSPARCSTVLLGITTPNHRAPYRLLVVTRLDVYSFEAIVVL